MPCRSCRHPVADRDGLFDGLEADRVVGEPGDRERARDRAGGHHDDVVLELPRLADLGVIVAVFSAWPMPVTFAVIDLGPLEVATLGDDRVARLDRTGRDLGEERLVRHVRQRVDDGDLGLAPAQPLLELPGRVEAGVAATDDQDLGHGLDVSLAGEKRSQSTVPGDGLRTRGRRLRRARSAPSRAVRRPAAGCRRAAAWSTDGSRVPIGFSGAATRPRSGLGVRRRARSARSPPPAG